MGLQQLGVEGKLESRFCTLKSSYKSIHLASQVPTASSPRRCRQPWSDGTAKHYNKINICFTI